MEDLATLAGLARTIDARSLGIHVTLVEPGAFRTEFAGVAAMKAATRITDYAALDAGLDEYFAGQDGRQIGDPAKGMQVVTQVDQLLHGEENVVCADAGYTGVEKRPEHEGRQVIWQIAARRSTYKKHGKRSVLYKAIRKIEKAKAQVRAKVEHPFRVIKRQFGYTKVRFRGLAKNAAQMVTLFALSNLWMARRNLLADVGAVRL